MGVPPASMSLTVSNTSDPNVLNLTPHSLLPFLDHYEVEQRWVNKSGVVISRATDRHVCHRMSPLGCQMWSLAS